MDAPAPRFEELLRFHVERRVFDRVRSIVAGGVATWSPASLFGVSGFVEIPDAEVRERTVSLLGSLAGQSSGIVFWIHGDGRRLRFLYGTLADGPVRDDAERLLRALRAYYPGAETSAVRLTDADRMRHELGQRTACAVITGVPSEREQTPVETRLDEALDGLAAVPFDLVLLATPIDACDVGPWEESLGAIADVMHSMARRTISSSESEAFGRSLQQTLSTTLTSGRSRTVAESLGVSAAKSSSVSSPENAGTHAVAVGAGAVVGALAGGAIGTLAGPVGTVAGAKLGAILGSVAGGGLARAIDPARTRTDSVSLQLQAGHSVSDGTSDSVAEGTSEAESVNISRQLTQQVSCEQVRREALAAEQLLQEHLDRLRLGRGVGVWRTTVHALADSAADLAVVSSILLGALRGDKTWIEPLRWTPYENGLAAAQWVAAFDVPRLALAPSPIAPGLEQLPTPLTTYELAHWMRPPIRELPGFKIRPPTAFARNPEPLTERAIVLGHLQHRGRQYLAEPVAIDCDDLAAHGFVTGTTGSGKTTTVSRLLLGLQKLPDPVPFLLVEPAKSEYDALFFQLEAMGRRPLRLIAGARGPSGFHIDPLRVPEGLPVGRHVDAIRILLRSAFAMQESLPQLLERVLVRAYQDVGLGDFAALYPGAPARLPTLIDVATNVERMADAVKGYPISVREGLKTALEVRLGSLASGLKAVVFDESEGSRVEDMLDRPVFVQLSDINDPDARRILLGALILRLYGLREAKQRRGEPARGVLKHLLVLEEAHHLLRSAQGMGPGADLVRQVNQFVADAFAELRAFGQGLLVVDQSPAALDESVIRNTNVKIVHRLLHSADCRAVGESMALDEDEQMELRRLSRGEALVFGRGLARPILTKVLPIPPVETA